jgi:stage II sporulation protein D
LRSRRVPISSLRAVEVFCKTDCERIHGLKAGKARPISAVFLIALCFLFSTACGRHNANVKPPLPPKLVTAPTVKTQAPPKKPALPTPQRAPAEDKTAEVDVQEPVVPVPELPAPNVEFAPGPLIRIGLTTDAKEIRISSSGAYSLKEKIAEAPQELVQGEIRVRVEQEAGAGSDIYRIQVASFSKSDLAQDLQAKLTDAFTQPVVVRENPASGLIQVRIGEFAGKEDAQSFQKVLADAGYPDSFIVKESAPTANGEAGLGLRGPNRLFHLSRAGFLFQPSSRTAFLSLNGKPYRGVFDISLNKSGRITVVNQLGMEEYLLGVVPAEISPTAYPEFAGLAALAIAARTYALHGMGKFQSDGFDLTDDTRTQVYEGLAKEKEATTEAVHQTAGLAIYYQDKIIDAMYMSTCGGRTEDFDKVFDSDPVPYLKSVFCAVESGPEKGETALPGKHDLNDIIQGEDGGNVNRNLELARVLGILERGKDLSGEFLDAPAQRSEITRWVEAAARVAQRQTASSGPLPDLRTRAGFFEYAAETLFGNAEIRHRVSPRDIEYFIGNLKDGETVAQPARPALSYLMQNGLWRPNAGNTVRPNEPIRRADALSLLVRWIEAVRPEILRKGTFVSAGSNTDETSTDPAITIKWGNNSKEFRISRDAYLFRIDPGRVTPVDSLKVIGNEKLSFHADPQGIIDFLEIELSPTGASSDRYSPVAAWGTTMSRSAIAEKLRGMTGNIGTFRDLKPFEIGESGRAVKIQIIGSRNSVVLNGYKVRNALGLRDTLFTVTREHSPDGTIASFTFHGRGFGHGVGLCQVGAFGMARAGRSYEEILKHYYQGVQIRKAY